MHNYYVYILQSQKDNSYYIGYSQNPESRLKKHNNANTGYTSSKKPWKLEYTEKYETKTLAIKREKYIKKQKSVSFIIDLIEKKIGVLTN